MIPDQYWIQYTMLKLGLKDTRQNAAFVDSPDGQRVLRGLRSLVQQGADVTKPRQVKIAAPTTGGRKTGAFRAKGK